MITLTFVALFVAVAVAYALSLLEARSLERLSRRPAPAPRRSR